MEKLIIYTPSIENKHLEIKELLSDRFLVDIVGKKDLHKTIAQILANDEIDENTFDSVDFDFILFPTMERENLSVISNQLQERNINIERKAMITQHNVNWKLFDLLIEIDREHEYFKVREKLHKLFNKAVSTPLDSIHESKRAGFQTSIVKVYDLLRSECDESEEFEQAYLTLLAVYNDAITVKE